MKTNVILIGMPGAGKSTIGVVAAKTLGLAFVDTDLLIQQEQQCLLQQLIERNGTAAFLAAEALAVLGMTVENTVVATGGSVVYSPAAMHHLKAQGEVVYLQLPLEEIERRLTNMASRGIAMGPGQQLSDLYQERAPLYEKYADRIVDCRGLELEQTVERVVQGLKL